MTFDPTKPVQTRDGRKARIICTDAAGRQPIIAIVRQKNGEDEPYSFHSDGAFHYNPAITSETDLINVPKTKS